MKIRKATKSDYKDLMGLYIKAGFSKSGENSFAKVLNHKLSFIFVAEDKEKLVGFITFQARYVIRHKQPIGQIEELFIKEKFRKQGIGKALIQEAEKVAVKLGCHSVCVESGYQHRPAHKFYQHMDYKKSGNYFLKKAL